MTVSEGSEQLQLQGVARQSAIVTSGSIRLVKKLHEVFKELITANEKALAALEVAKDKARSRIPITSNTENQIQDLIIRTFDEVIDALTQNLHELVPMTEINLAEMDGYGRALHLATETVPGIQKLMEKDLGRYNVTLFDEQIRGLLVRCAQAKDHMESLHRSLKMLYKFAGALRYRVAEGEISPGPMLQLLTQGSGSRMETQIRSVKATLNRMRRFEEDVHFEYNLENILPL
ncbi:hypothetical protein BJ165DRAFT_765212 [Panaeolus papilionaceus]|nr:hypothetical protein BJ165DRAFT_765212 [Panaeolus papilionaceus]